MSMRDESTSTDSRIVAAPADARVAIVASQFNAEICEALLATAVGHLRAAGIAHDALTVVRVPGAFEIPVMAATLAARGNLSGILCVGCVIRGETDHFDHICRTAADGIARVALDYRLPVIFGVITAHTREQALARAGGAHGNMGLQGAQTLIAMMHAQRDLYGTPTTGA